MSTGYADNIVDEIKSRCNIVDVVGRTVNLKKTGSNHKGLCPFHSEKTPSFVVSEDKQIFTCFGCGATGDVIEFVKRLNNLDFREATERMAEEYGIEIKDHNSGDEGKRALLYGINREAAMFYFKCFSDHENKGQAYMTKRGLDAVTLRKFGIGYADEEWDSLYKYFVDLGTNTDILVELGLVTKSKDRYYDKFRNRIVFPIINTRGKVIGFGGRAIGDDNPKYLNSPESAIFQKKYNLYGLNLARPEIGRLNYAIIVEGYMDVISLYRHGIKNVVASLGTALTINQAAMIKRYTDNVILAYDGDEAGLAASLRGMDILQDAGCKVKILQMNGSKDPDEYVKKFGRDAFLVLVRESLPLTDYKIGLIRQKCDIDTTEGKLDFIKEITPILKKLKSPVEADTYIKKIARETRISEGALHLEVLGTNSKPQNPEVKSQIDPIKSKDANAFLEKTLIKLMVMKSEYIPKIKPYSSVFSIPGCYRIYNTIAALYNEDTEIDIKQLEDSLDQEDNLLLQDILQNISIADKEDRVFEGCINKIKRAGLLKRQTEILNILSMTDEDIEKEKIQELTQELIEIQSKTRNR